MPARINAATAKRLGLTLPKATAKSRQTKSDKFHAVYRYCVTRGYPLPVREHRFHPVRRWRFDAAWPELATPLAVEIHGAVFMQGGHTRGKGFSDDQEKFAHAAVAGWRVLPVTTGQFNAGDLWRYLDQEFGSVQC